MSTLTPKDFTPDHANPTSASEVVTKLGKATELPHVIHAYEGLWYERLANMAGNRSLMGGGWTGILSGGKYGGYPATPQGTLQKEIDEIAHHKSGVDYGATTLMSHKLLSKTEKLRSLSARLTVCEEMESALDALIKANQDQLKDLAIIRGGVGHGVMGKVRHQVSDKIGEAKHIMHDLKDDATVAGIKRLKAGGSAITNAASPSVNMILNNIQNKEILSGVKNTVALPFKTGWNLVSNAASNVGNMARAAKNKAYNAGGYAVDLARATKNKAYNAGGHVRDIARAGIANARNLDADTLKRGAKSAFFGGGRILWSGLKKAPGVIGYIAASPFMLTANLGHKAHDYFKNKHDVEHEMHVIHEMKAGIALIKEKTAQERTALETDIVRAYEPEIKSDQAVRNILVRVAPELIDSFELALRSKNPKHNLHIFYENNKSELKKKMGSAQLHDLHHGIEGLASHRSERYRTAVQEILGTISCTGPTETVGLFQRLSDVKRITGSVAYRVEFNGVAYMLTGIEEDHGHYKVSLRNLTPHHKNPKIYIETPTDSTKADKAKICFLNPTEAEIKTEMATLEESDLQMTGSATDKAKEDGLRTILHKAKEKPGEVPIAEYKVLYHGLNTAKPTPVLASIARKTKDSLVEEIKFAATDTFEITA